MINNDDNNAKTTGMGTSGTAPVPSAPSRPEEVSPEPSFI